jgi:hypothetical protein
MKVKIYPEEFDPLIASREATVEDEFPWTIEDHKRMRAIEGATPIQEVPDDFPHPVGIWVMIIEENRNPLFVRKTA